MFFPLFITKDRIAPVDLRSLIFFKIDGIDLLSSTMIEAIFLSPHMIDSIEKQMIEFPTLILFVEPKSAWNKKCLFW